MNAEELERVLEAAYARDKRWTTPSGAILDVIRAFISNGDLVKVAESISAYCKIHPIARQFICNAVPPMVVNWYKPLLEAADFGCFLEWTMDNPEWADNLSARADSNLFPTVVDDMVQSLKDYSSSTEGTAG